MIITAFNESIDLAFDAINVDFVSNYYCDDQQFYLNIPEIAKYLLLPKNNQLIVQMADGLTNNEFINTWLYGTVFAYLLQYRDYLVLHGSAVLVNGKAVIFSGDSGAGKSTTAAAMVARGYSLITDDVVAIKYNNDGNLVMVPGPSKVKLWSDALCKLNKTSDGLVQVISKENKFEVPINHSVPNEIPIAGFYELNHDNETQIITLDEITKIGKIQTLIKNTYRYIMLKPMGKLNRHLHDVAKLSANIKMYRILRPKDKFLLDELVNLIIISSEQDTK